MGFDIIEYKNDKYLSFQKDGNASQFILPFATKLCQGKGYDIGYCKKEWMLPGSIGIDKNDESSYDANNLPKEKMDYIFSSHCLEHVDDWVETLNYWLEHLKDNGVLFLYLPDYSQKYWRPWNNRKHKHALSPNIIKDFLFDKGCKNIFTTGVDLNNSFTVVCQK